MEAEDRRSLAVARHLHRFTYELPRMTQEDARAHQLRRQKQEKDRQQKLHRCCLLLFLVLRQCLHQHEMRLKQWGFGVLWRAYRTAAEAHRRQQAALLLQRAWRQRCRRLLITKALRQQKMLLAGAQLERVCRWLFHTMQQKEGAWALSELQQHAEYCRQLATSAATRIGAAWRCYATRRAFVLRRPLLLLQLPQNKKPRDLMERLQAVWRGAAARQQMRRRGLRLRCDAKKHASATQIQARRQSDRLGTAIDPSFGPSLLLP